MSDLAGAVRRRAGDLCEYCRLPQSAFRRVFHVEHIIALQHGGLNQLDNLALACWNCSFKKGPNLSGIDPLTGKLMALFHPRKDQWEEHFRPILEQGRPPGIIILGLTPVGRATIQVLGLNEEMRRLLRYELWVEGRYSLATP